MEDRLDIAFDDHIARVTLNRPDKYNALDLPMFLALDQAAKSLAARKDLRAIVLCGAGRGFCAGLDFESFMGMASGARADDGVDDLMKKVENSPANAPNRSIASDPNTIRVGSWKSNESTAGFGDDFTSRKGIQSSL